MKKSYRALCATMSLTTILASLSPLAFVHADTTPDTTATIPGSESAAETSEESIAKIAEEFSAVSELYSDSAMETFQALIEESYAQNFETTDDMQVLENALSEYQAKKQVSSSATPQNLTVYDGCDWNFNMISDANQPQTYANTAPTTNGQIKVAIIDSGVNFSTDINVAERKNFIDDGDEEDGDISILYEDFSGHGTNIAGVIAAQQNDLGITGGNPNVILYSARVLDGADQAPISRIVEAIDWAIEKNVNIINLSFVTTTDSPELRAAIKRAYNAGILIIAAAGNNGYVAYPAAYPEVMAIGSVNSKGDLSSFSPLQGAVELLAPGELITSTDVFDTVSTHSGTSYAAPHVTVIASKLWERDPSVSASYIRCVLDVSANLFSSGTQYGYGMIDYDFACVVFDALKPFAAYSDQFDTLMRFAIEICGIQNPNDIPKTDLPENVVEGAWWLSTDETSYAHMDLLDGLSLKSANGRAILMAGCYLPDLGELKIKGMKENSFFHGYAFYVPEGESSDHTKYVTSNYIASTLYLTKIAQAMVRGNTYTEADDYITIKQNGKTICALNDMIDNTYVNKRDNVKWSDIKSLVNNLATNEKGGDRTKDINFNPNDKIHRGLFVYGMALHNIGDTFSHSSVWAQARSYIIPHDNADTIGTRPNRYAAASDVCKNALRQMSKMNSSSNTSGTAYSTYDACDIRIFNFNKDFTDGVYLANFLRYAQEVCKYSNIFKSTNGNYYNEDFYKIINVKEYYIKDITSGKRFFNPVKGEFEETRPNVE